MSFSSSNGQTQERSLVDRLLRPDMSLQNRAQTKKFATKSLSLETHGTVGTFYLLPRSQPEPVFGGTGSFSTKRYEARQFLASPQRAPIADRKLDIARDVSAPAFYGVHAVPDAGKSVVIMGAADQFPFRGQGKSQKSLDRQNPPLTIEQVRELLNKNK